MTNKWVFLKEGDIVDIVAPSNSAHVEDLALYYQKVKDILSAIGLVARLPDDLIDKSKDLFSANSLEYRTQHLVYSLTNPESKAVWAIRGGYGASKIIPVLETIEPPKQAKLLLGFSDITVLHLFVQNKWHWTSLHSPVLNQIVNNAAYLEPLKPILFGQETVHYDQLRPLNEAAKQEQIIDGDITGGNLSMVQTSLATSWQINAKDKIIFLEDVNEEGYRLDRMLNHFLQAGVFAQAKAVIFGEFTPPKDHQLCGPAIENFAQQLNIQVLSFPFIGHGDINLPLPLGSSCSLSLGVELTLTCVTGGIHEEDVYVNS